VRYPPRLGHLATKSVLIAKLAPTFAEAHTIDDEEARQRLQAALNQRFIEDILASIWTALIGKTKRLDEAGLLEKVAKSLKDRPERPGRVATVNPAWSAFLVVADVHAGTASDAARKVIEQEANRPMVEKGLAEAGQFLAAELTR
jgi:hypothetical protein